MHNVPKILDISWTLANLLDKLKGGYRKMVFVHVILQHISNGCILQHIDNGCILQHIGDGCIFQKIATLWMFVKSYEVWEVCCKGINEEVGSRTMTTWEGLGGSAMSSRCTSLPLSGLWVGVWDGGLGGGLGVTSLPHFCLPPLVMVGCGSSSAFSSMCCKGYTNFLIASSAIGWKDSRQLRNQGTVVNKKLHVPWFTTYLIVTFLP